MSVLTVKRNLNVKKNFLHAELAKINTCKITVQYTAAVSQ